MNLRAVFTILFVLAGSPALAAPPTGIQAMPLARRCEIARLVAFQAAEMFSAFRPSSVMGRTVGVLVWVGEPEPDEVHGAAQAEQKKLIRADESCDPVLFPGARIEVVGRGVSLADACLAFMAKEHDGTLALVMEMDKPESCAAQEPSDKGIRMISGRAIVGQSLPEIKIDIAIKTLSVTQAAIVFPRFSGPVP